ncbi:MAG: hypothetical protein KF857_06280 [Fimbriimonadaceae bacterium]|nr:hypothetical protein [Fimbriimonadaceae bacterium]
MIAAIAVLAFQQPKLDFNEIEVRKHDAFAALKSFKGRYRIVTVPANGTAIVQEVIYVFSPTGRQVLVTVNEKAVVEMGWTAKETWRVAYTDRKYMSQAVEDGLKPKPFKALAVENGQVNFVVGEEGMRLNAEPVPVVNRIVDDKVDGEVMTKVSASSKNVVTGGELRVDQWFAKGDWVVRRFDISSLQDGVVTISVRGTLQGADFKAATPVGIGKLPTDQLKGFTREKGPGGT